MVLHSSVSEFRSVRFLGLGLLLVHCHGARGKRHVCGVREHEPEQTAHEISQRLLSHSRAHVAALCFTIADENRSTCCVHRLYTSIFKNKKTPKKDKGISMIINPIINHGHDYKSNNFLRAHGGSGKRMREKGEEIELPESWRRSWSATYNRPYYWHKRTKQQTWKLPKVENGQECEAPSLSSPDDLAKQQWPVPAPDSACGTPDAAPASACATPAAAAPDGPDGVMPLTSSNVASLTSMTPQPLAQCGDRGSGSPCDARAVPQRGKGSDHFARLAATAEALGRSRDFGLSAPPDSDFSAPAARADRTPTSWQQPERPGRRNEGSSAAPLFSISFEGVEHHGSSGRDASEQPALGGEPGARTDAEPQAHTRSPRPGGESPEQVLRCSTNDADGPEHGGRKESLEISASCAPTKFAHVNGGTASAEAVAHDERRALRDKELLEFEIEEVHDCPHGDGETAAIHVHTENKRLSADGVTLGAGPVDVQRQRVLQENAQVATGRIRVLPQRHVEETILARQAILEGQGWYASREDTKVPTYRLLPHFRGPDLQRGVGETCGDETGTGRSSHTPFMPPASLAGEELAPRRKHGAEHLMQSAGITFTRSCTNGDTPQASSASNCSLQLVVAKIAPSSAADWSGVIEVGDVLVSVNGTLAFTPAYTSCTYMPSCTHAMHHFCRSPCMPGDITRRQIGRRRGLAGVSGS